MVMRIRKTNAILGTALIIGVLMMIYLVIDTISYEDLDAQKEELNGLEIKLRSLENDLLVNQKTIDLIKGQKISKANCGVLNSSKEPTKIFSLISVLSSKKCQIKKIKAQYDVKYPLVFMIMCFHSTTF